MIEYYDFKNGVQTVTINDAIVKIENDIDRVFYGYIRVTVAKISYFLYVDENRQYVIRKTSDSEAVSSFYGRFDKNDYVNDFHNMLLIAAGLFTTKPGSFYDKFTR